MSERYFSLHPEESSKMYLNYNVIQAQAPSQHSLVGMAAQLNNEYDYIANAATAYYTVNGGGFVDMNNNRSATRYYNVGAGCGVGKQNICSGNNAGGHIYTNKVLPSSLMTKYTNAGSYMHGGGAAAMTTPHMSTNETSISHHHSQGHYNTHAHASTSTYGYQRNRYMPYNRCNTSTANALHQHPLHSTAAITTCGGLTTAVSNGYHQFAAPIYQTCTPGAAMQTFTSTIPMSAVSVSQQTQLHPNSMTSTMTTASHSNGGGQGFTYAHAVAASIAAPTSVVAATTIPTSDNKNSNSLATVTAPSVSTAITSTPYTSAQTYATVSDPNDTVTLQITNLDYSMDEVSLRNFLLNQLKPITPVVSLTFEGSSYAKVTVPDLYFAKQVVSNLHRKKIGHKRMLVSYTRDSSLTEINTLRCQVAGLLKDVPCYTLPMYKFRELFQSRFKTSISVLDLYKMQDICIINSDNNEEKFISLHSDLVNSLESSPLMEGLQHSVPYCTMHFKREQHKGWAEQEIEPLPNVFMTITEIQQIVHPLLKNHTGDIPVASLVHCIEGQLKVQITPNESGVNLEHLICCVQGIQITVNNFGIKILGWLELNKENGQMSSASNEKSSLYSKNSISDPLYQISREVIELVKMSPKATMKFNRFIPAYHNHFGKQCRVADYGYTKLIELFEALSSVVQIMGDGENRQITLTHRTQIRRFTSDLLRVLRAHGNKSVLLSQLPTIFAQTQNRTFDVTDYGVCDIGDILDGLVNSNIVVVSTVQNGEDILISMPKRKQTSSELEKTCIFAGEIVELFSNAPQYTILFQKFVRSYHYHFGYQCRLSDYGFQKLADLVEAVHGVVEMELTNDEDKKIYLTAKVARRIFAEQCEELIATTTGSAKTCMKWDDVVKLHKKKYGYQIQSQTLGVKDIMKALDLLPYIETFEKDDGTWIICHKGDKAFRTLCYKACKLLLSHEADLPDPKTGKEHEAFKNLLTLEDFIKSFNEKNKETLTENTVKAMKHAIEIIAENDCSYVKVSGLMHFIMNIIRLLEQRSPMLLLDIKNALDCSITSTFEFGYPNLFSVISTYSDLFYVNAGVPLERSEVGLAGNAELRLTSYANHKHLFGSLKLPYNKQKSSRTTTRPPLAEHNNNRIATSSHQETPARTRTMSIDSNYNSSHASSTSTSNYRSQNSCSFYQQQQQPRSTSSSSSLSSSTYCPKSYTSSCGSNAYNNMSNSSSIYSMASNNSNILNSSISSGSNNKENSFSSSFMFNNSFNTSSNMSSTYNDLNSSMNSLVNTMGCIPQPAPATVPINNSIHLNPSMPSVYPTSKLWDRRHGNNFYQQQPQQPLMNANANLSGGSGLPQLIMGTAQPQTLSMPSQATVFPAMTTETSAGLYELVNNIQMCPVLYEPPKPDTPPSENMPFWIDPIWKNNNNEKPKDDLLNIRLPELKALNVLPMVLSPYSLSKTENMKQVFNFESHDRKIA
ncbi:meiosis regulator and mRNA stability factor 1 isoform X1 [Stomoxys calcitrans]|uniref:meiosis regulator and mRNA stability factor 1 isoform X1 n=2 Tax=Stomoxys calcitrans TaxID=35570 RepID=UPI0027E3AB65|nr:meiosis regulator and mRNA stability factor 1 isoform X1 [Stomoxys calcitrans]XP_013101996.2 meiosis regulator and mRNA stability factor 1 isoform X1 [Stomoxys calcitrans]